MFSRKTRTTKPARTTLRLEALEAREVPALLIQIDYSRDTSGFFSNPEARATLEQVAAELGNGLNANLSAITPGGGNTWTATFFDPATGGQTSLSNLSIGANTIKVFVGARALGGSEAGFGGFGGFSVSGSQAWLNTVQTRGHIGFAPWGGSITFDSRQNWYFGSSAAGLDSSKLDFYSVASHELGHILGIGTAQQWKNLVSGGTFHGSGAMSVYGGPVPVNAAGDHWADGVTVNGQAVSLDPSLPYGQRVAFSALDSAALSDLGWSAGGGGAAAVGGGAAPAQPAITLVPIVQANGTIIQYAVVNGAVIPTGQVFAPFGAYRGPLYAAYADFNRDGTLDVAVGTADGRIPGILAVISGTDGHYLGGPQFAHGKILAMLPYDVEGDGQVELVTLEGTPAGIFVYNVVGNGLIAPNSGFSAYGTPGRAAETTDYQLDRTGFGDTVSQDYSAPDQSDAGKKPNQPDSAIAPAPYTASAEPMKKCSCPGCQALARMAGADESNTAAWENDVLGTVRVA